MAIHHPAAAVNCSTGNLLQQFKCGWNHPTGPAHPSMAYSFGHGVLPLLVIVAFVVLLVLRSMVKRQRAAAQPAPSGRRALARR